MWRKLRKQIDVERQMLRQLLADHAPLLLKCAVSEPDRIELSALAAMLHGFYNGIENIFKRTAIELGDALPEGPGWHKSLLESMTCPASGRPAVVSVPLAEALRGYLEFRHFFRGAYPFQLRWDRMSSLTTECGGVLSRLETELDAFLKATEGRE